MLAGAALAPRALCARAQPMPDVVFVPTAYTTVKRMLDLARVGSRDIVYDLGCGDGRIVVTAAQEYGARGVGIDIDAGLIRDARGLAQQLGVADKVRFIEGDLFDADISEATVVTLYLLTRLNVKLRPKLLRELKPGTRIVSHAFGMGDWPPDEVVRDGASSIFLWRVPARG
jgi:SAM-dependent methyltransferase